MKKSNVVFFLSIILFSNVVMVFSQKTTVNSQKRIRDCGKISPTSKIRPTGDLPCSDTRFFSDYDFETSSSKPFISSLEINRFVGNPKLMEENGFLEPTTKLRVAAIQVLTVSPATGQTAFSEIGEIIINNKSIKINSSIVNISHPVRDYVVQTTDGFSLIEFDIPTNLLNFPVTRQPAVNTIEIKPLFGSLKVDWLSLEVKVAPPVLLIHGFNSDSGTWTKWTEEGGFLERTGLPTNTIDLSSTIAENAEEIGKRIETLKQEWDVDKITLVGHSKGGLDARYFAENSDSVSRVIMIGTPNGGSPMVDILLEGLSKNWQWNTLLSVLDTFTDKVSAAKELSPENMAKFNKNLKSNPKVEYIAIGGDFTPKCKAEEDDSDNKCKINKGLISKVGKGDLWVSLESVYSLPYANNLPPIVSTSETPCEILDSTNENNSGCEATHLNLLKSEKLFQVLKPYIGKP